MEEERLVMSGFRMEDDDQESSLRPKTLRDYVEQQRIKKAINLLQTTNLTLTQIAFECGFSSQSYFSYVFKRRMKKSPREYIKELYNMYEM